MKTRLHEKNGTADRNKKWAVLSLLGLSSLIKKSSGLAFDLVKIKSSLFYLETVQAVRQFFIALFQVVGTMMILSLGVVSLHVGIFIFLPWSGHTKAFIALILGGVYLATATAVLFYLFSGGRWLKGAIRYCDFLEDVIKKSESKKSTKSGTAFGSTKMKADE
ncbi:MAG: hypothetical protein HY585_00965 [Candidatus Omnitrophica bacterium]|nr:hypothetical protein [Candidatus Omnitrophota bacterium]